METYFWKTLDYHPDNSFTMEDYLQYHLPENAKVISQDGTYAEVEIDGTMYGVHASGEGDSRHHKVEFEKLKQQ